MNNVYSVIGSNGSGKSTVSLLLANELKNQNTCIISFDKLTPMLNVYEPFTEFSSANSLGKLLNEAINIDNLRDKITRSKANKNLCFLAFVTGDNESKYPEMLNSKKIVLLIELLEEVGIENIIFDLTSNFDNLTNYCLAISTKILYILNTTTSSLSYLDSHKLDTNVKNVVYVLNNYFDFSPFETIKKEREISICVPHTREIYESYLTGDFKKLTAYLGGAYEE